MRAKIRDTLLPIVMVATTLAPINARANDIADINNFSNNSKLKVEAGYKYSEIGLSDDLGNFAGFDLGGVSVDASTSYFNARYKFLDGKFQPYLQIGVAQTEASFEHESPYLDTPDKSITSMGAGGGFIFRTDGLYTRLGVSGGKHFFKGEENKKDIRGSAFAAVDISSMVDGVWAYGTGGFNSKGEKDNGVNPYDTYSFEAGFIKTKENFYFGFGGRDEIIDGGLEIPGQKKHRPMIAIKAGYSQSNIFDNSSMRNSGDRELGWGVHGYGYFGKETTEVGVQVIFNY